MLNLKLIKVGFLFGMVTTAIATHAETKPMRVNSFLSESGTKILVQYNTEVLQTGSNKPGSAEVIKPLILKVHGPKITEKSKIRALLVNQIRSEGTCNFPITQNEIAQTIYLKQDSEGFFVGEFPQTLLRSWAYCNFAHSERLELSLIVDGEMQKNKDTGISNFILKIDAPQP